MEEIKKESFVLNTNNKEEYIKVKSLENIKE